MDIQGQPSGNTCFSQSGALPAVCRKRDRSVSNKRVSKARLSTSVVARLNYDGKGKQQVIRDDKTGPNYVRGFCLYLYRGGEKSYFVKLPANNKSGYRMVKLGSALKGSGITCEQAKLLALKAWEDYRLNKPINPRDELLTVSVAVARFLKEYRTKGKGRTIHDDSAWCAYMGKFSDAYPHRELGTISTNDLQKLVAGLTTRVAERCKSNWSTFFAYVCSQPWCEASINPAKHVVITEAAGVVPSKATKSKKMLSKAQQLQVIAAAETSKNKLLPLLIRLAFATGHRPGELWKISWQNVNLETGEVTAKGTKKNRMITMPPKEYFPQACAEARKILQELHAITGEMGRLFPGVQYKSIAATWKRIAKKHGIDFHLSQGRSTAISEAFWTAHEKSYDEAMKTAQHRGQHIDQSITEHSYVVEQPIH